MTIIHNKWTLNFTACYTVYRNILFLLFDNLKFTIQTLQAKTAK